MIDILFNNKYSVYLLSLVISLKALGAVQVFNLERGVLQSVVSPVPHRVDFPAQRAPLSC